MFYYAHHIGDFRAGTFNMTQHERWMYRDMLDAYYDSERPFPENIDDICKLLGIRNDADRETVVAVLGLKFTLKQTGYHNERCDKEIKAYHAKALAAKRNGKLGGRPPKSKAK